VSELSSTSYALLGLLAIRPWSAYELSKQVKRSLAFYWPRAERGIYDEPKKLVARGLAQASSASTGKRKRTMYSITRKGREVLVEWLHQPSASPQFESEAMLRVAFAENGSIDDLVASIRSVRAHAALLRAQAEEVLRGYANDEGPFPQRIHIITLTGKFNIGYIAMLERWADWAERTVDEHWTDTSSPEGFPASAEVIRSLLDELVASAPRAAASRRR
jgi:PadR family transcriptional regulator, regulatory protein AphA